MQHEGGLHKTRTTTAAPFGIALGGHGRHLSPERRQLIVQLDDAPLQVADTGVCKQAMM